jgi:calcineurin-like phosphoesterase family protein
MKGSDVMGKWTQEAKMEAAKKREQRRKDQEEELLQRLKDANQHPDAHNVAKLIDETRKNGNTVYLATDWHLWKRLAKNQPACEKRKDFNKIIREVETTVKMNDLLINLGDLVDGEFQAKDVLKEQMKEIGCKKVLVRGNNDLFDNAFYKSCGFLYVVDSFKWHDILFTHCPVENDCDLNIHGHIHSHCPGAKDPYPENNRVPSYWLPYTNQIDVAWLGARVKPVELSIAIKSQPEFSKHIKECPEHFGEMELLDKNKTLFMMVMEEGSSFIHDPFYD